MSQRSFYISCTLLWVRIIPVKVDRSLTGIFRLYKNIHVKANVFILAFMHLCLVRLWLLRGEKTGESNTFLYFLWYSDKGEDYTIQSRSEFDCYNPHLYNYSRFRTFMLSSTKAFMW